MSDLNVAMGFIDPPEPADEKAVGSWRCSCGVTAFYNVRASVGFSVQPRCRYCGDECELLPLPLEPKP